MPPPLVLFDLDNTLVDRQSALAVWASAFRARYGLTPGDGTWVRDLLAARATPDHFATVRNRLGLTASAESLWGDFCRTMAHGVVCQPDVLAGLEELRATGWRTGILTNGPTDVQSAKLRATGIVDRVDAVCISEEAGRRKPDPGLFHEAVRRCGGREGAGVSAAWMVGDNPVHDIEGGRAAGLRTVWIDRGPPWPPVLPEPDHRVGSARAAIDVLLATAPKGPAR